MVIVFCFYFTDEWITKIYEYAHEYQISTVLPVAEDAMCKRVKNESVTAFYDHLSETIHLLLFAEKFTMSKLKQVAVDKLSAVSRKRIRLLDIYNDLSVDLKFMIADRRLEKMRD